MLMDSRKGLYAFDPAPLRDPLAALGDAEMERCLREGSRSLLMLCKEDKDEQDEQQVNNI